MFRASREELETCQMPDLFVVEDREVLAANILKIVRGKDEFEGEIMFQRPDGTTFLGFLSASAWPWNNGMGIVLTIHDMTKLKNLENEAKKSEHMAFLGRMLDDISHQIRNPVLAIGGFARRLAKMDVPRPDYIRIILEETAYLELILNTLTDFLKMARPRLRLISVRELFEKVKPDLQRTAGEHGARIVFSFPAFMEDDKALADPDAFAQAIEMVVINACEAYENSDGEKVIDVWLEKPEDERWACAFCIRDQSLGIRPNLLPIVFSPFFTTKTGHKGMGLTFAKRIQEEQIGDLAIESEMGQGTTVRLFLHKDRRSSLRTQKIP